jgi:Peptidase family M28
MEWSRLVGRSTRDGRSWSVVAAVVALFVCLAVLASCARPAEAIRRSSPVAALLQAVGNDQAQLEQTLNELSGAAPATVGGAAYTFSTRACGSGTPIDKAEQYVYEHLRAIGQGVGLSGGLDAVRYQSYGGSEPGRNVIGEIRGTTRPREIVVVAVHLDDEPLSGRAPDDDGTGCAALLWLAEHFAGHSFARTVRFVFFGSEEEGHLGSGAFATAARQAGEKLVAVLDVDMVGRNASGANVVALHTRNPAGLRAAQSDLWIAKQYLAAVAVYDIPLLKPHIVARGNEWSDYENFWEQGYGATGLIEDDPFSNPYYHTSGDTVAHLSWGYYVRVTKGVVATAAHLAYMDGMLPSSRISVSGMTIRGVTTRTGRRGVRVSVRVRDTSFTTVLGATVRGRFTGATSGYVSGRTDSGGSVTFTSPTNLRGGTWTFTVRGVAKSGWTYDPALNARTSISLRYKP